MTVTVVLIDSKVRCVYMNDHRLVGPKPYVSERGKYTEFPLTIEDLRAALPDYTIKKKRTIQTMHRKD